MRPVASEIRKLGRLAFPIAIAQAGMSLMGVVDTAVVGRMGPGPLGAVGLANGVFFAICILGMGAMMGFDPLMSQAIGAQQRGRAHGLLWQAYWMAALLTVALAVPVALSPLLLEPLGIPRAIAVDARAFILSRLPGMFPFFLFIGARSYLQSVGRTRPMVVVTVVANLLNLALDVLLVFGGAGLPAWTGPLRAVPALGVVGAGLATSTCAVVQFAVLAWAIHREASPAPEAKKTPHGADLRAAFKLGAPIGLQMGAEVGVFALAGIFAGRMGEHALAAHQIALSLASFTFCFGVGIGSAASVRVGWAVGALDRAGARRSGLVAFASGGAVMSISAVVFWLFPEALASAMGDPAAASVLTVAAVFQISDGLQAVGAGALRGLGDTRFTFLANVAGHYGLGLPLGLLLGLTYHGGVRGIWWGLCASLTVVAAALIGRFLLLSAKPVQPVAQPITGL